MENNIKNNIGIKNIGINKSDDVKNNNGKINETIYEFLKKYGIKTNNPIYLRGFTHSSYAKQRKIEDYEKLEFLGDAILEFCVSKYIYKNFNSLNVGEMSKKRMLLTQGTTLSSCFKTFNLDKEIKIINLPNNQIPNRIYEDLYESLIGCLFLDKGINVCQQFIEQTLIKFSFLNKDEIIDDYKTKLQ
ncbi:MAG: hypothetical protein LBF02_01060, partial [Mycoplasmataceae bacterium]|nr:hypothetical protein [Mycoplasmataceae bacterium]